VVTALFTDIRNFTAVTETKWPEEIVDTLNHYLDVQTKVIHEHHGVVDKFIGDGVMSIFSGTDMAQNAVKAAIEIQQRVTELNKKRRKDGEIVLEVGIGIATGVAVLGSIGSRDRMDYTAIGDTINLAARLCGVAEPAQILVTDTVVSRLNGEFNAINIGKMTFKGKHEKIQVGKIPFTV
jgi:adenylate cyclase